MSPPKYKRMTTGLKCNNCGHEFEGLARHVPIQTRDRGVLNWIVDSGDAFGGVAFRC
jgi:ribosomal protein L34E